MANRKKRPHVLRWIVLLVLLGVGVQHRAQLTPVLHILSAELRHVRSAGKDIEEEIRPEESHLDGVAYSDLPETEEDIGDGYYYRKLRDEEQVLYRQLFRGVRRCEAVIEVDETDSDTIGKVYQFLLYDRPELFWCTGEMTITSYVFHAELEPVYSRTGASLEKRQKRLDHAVERCLSGITTDATDYQRVKYVFEYLVNSVDYDRTAKNNQTLYSALVRGESVCAGYSRAAQYLVQKLEIPCIYVTGTAEGADHAWNIVRCDGKYYQLDVTFGDPAFSGTETGQSNINYGYLCCSDEELYRNHTPSDEVTLPECRSKRLNYYVLHDQYYSIYDRDGILDAMIQSIEDEKGAYFCQFANKALFEQAQDDIVDDLLPQAARHLAGWFGLSSGRYVYVIDDDSYTITVYWDYG